jgi:hypothetical protein
MVENAMTPESSWQQIGAKFLQGADWHPDLYAHWDGSQEMWTLRLAQSHQLFNPPIQRLSACLLKQPRWQFS